jgi:hypothetical protein
MKFKTIAIYKSIICLLFGPPMVLFPEFVYGIFGMDLSTAGGIYAARLLGAAFTGILVLVWIARNAQDSDARRGFVYGDFVWSIIGLIVAILGTLTGVTNALGWLLVAAWFGVFLLQGIFILNGQKP